MDLVPRLKAGYPCLVIETVEDKKTLQEVVRQAFTLGSSGDPIFKKVYVWSVTMGMQEIAYTKDWEKKFKVLTTKRDEDIDLYTLLPKLTTERYKDSIMVFLDAHLFRVEDDPQLNRMFKDLISNAEEVLGSCIVFLGVRFDPPPEWSKRATIIEYGLPTRSDLSQVLDGSIKSIENGGADKIKLKEDDREKIVTSALGMTTFEASNAFPLSFIEVDRIDPEIVMREKMMAVKKSGFMKFIPNAITFEDIGGVEVLKDWVRKRRSAYSIKAKDFGLPPPRGILLVGIPGSGKSYVAKSVGFILGLPTLQMDYGSVFSSLVGESERKMREAITLAEAVSPCVFWVDEIDKAVSGAKSDLDSGVSRRVLGYFLTWMQERDPEKPVFVVATANQVSHLPPELLRKGRFDEIFAVNLPNEMERREIFKIHINKRGRKVEKFNTSHLASLADEFTGSEIEESVISGLFEAFDSGKELNDDHIIKAIEETIPLSKSMKDDIDRLKDWIGKRARDASAPFEGMGRTVK
jgi:AAA+ superfamily predicted ATPase